jgi:hypothetical protein
MHTYMLPRVGLGQHVRSFKANELRIDLPPYPGVPGCIQFCLNEWADTLAKGRHGFLLESVGINRCHVGQLFCSSCRTEIRMAVHGKPFCGRAASRA